MDNSVWKLAPPREEAGLLAAALGIPRTIAQVLVNREITSPEAAQRFLYGSLDDIHDPFLMAGMAEAVERILRAVESGERILIFGDYDVDGVLSVVMLLKALGSLGARVDYFIPERLKEGYGIKDDHVEIVASRGAGLVISVDCGIKANGFVRLARARGIDVIITDHHRPGSELPEAFAILNPALQSSPYPERNLAGVGVVYKLIQALLEKRGKAALLRHYLKLVSIGTISDIAEIKGENRLFVKFGLKELDDVANPGLRSLIEISGLKGKRISEGDVGFRIGPRINAAGRMGLTELAVKLFTSSSPEESDEIARRLDELNAKRQTTEERILRQAFDKIKANAWDRSYRILILGSEEWHRGVIGIVASRLKEAFCRPVILFSYDDGKAFGSGRSITEFSLIDCLEECRSHFLSYGGHKHAVGCTLKCDDMPSFKAAANAVADSRITEEQMTPKVGIDAKLGFAEIDNELFHESLSLLKPYGVGNPRPVFWAERVRVCRPPRILKGKHVKFELNQDGRTFEGLGWGKAEWAVDIATDAVLDVVFSLQSNHFLGVEKPYLSLEAIKKST